MKSHHLGAAGRAPFTARILALAAVIFLMLSASPPGTLPLRGNAITSADSQSDPSDLEKYQGYLNAAPQGMNVWYAWQQPGGRGDDVKIIDIENDWNVDHNDLKAATSNLLVYDKGVDTDPADDVNHGTAVLGEIVATNNGVGVTGIVSSAQLGLINPQTSADNIDIAAAIAKAASLLEPGDVILVEQQAVGPGFNPATGTGLVPPEIDTRVFTAIHAATSQGIVVVEPASNGSANLDDPAFGGFFDRTKQDSGAIIVGAGLPEGDVYGPGPDRTRIDTSDYGSRVDLQGWGKFVTSTGYGDLRFDQGPNNWYTINFGGTSAAAAMVAGAAASLESMLKAAGHAPLPPLALRALLGATGSPQTGDVSQNIGPRPDLQAALAAVASGQTDPSISNVTYSAGRGRLIVNGANFLPGDSIIEVNSQPIGRIKYPAGFFQPNGSTTRLMSKGNVTSLLPAGVAVQVTVFTPSTGASSPPFSFTR